MSLYCTHPNYLNLPFFSAKLVGYTRGWLCNRIMCTVQQNHYSGTNNNSDTAVKLQKSGK